MSQAIVLNSFAELADALDLDALRQDAFTDESVDPMLPEPTADPAPDLAALLEELQRAGETLTAIARRDQEAKAEALRDLERYDQLVARQREVERAREQAQQVRHEAEALDEGAFADEARKEAARIVSIAIQAEVAATDAAHYWQGEVERLTAQLDLDRLLAERRRREEAEKAKAAEAERTRRLAGALTRARAALEAGRFEEAKELLGTIGSERPDNPEITTLKTIIAQRELTVKVDAVEETLWEARRVYRHDAATAVARLEALDTEGLPEPLARQVFGEWARACSCLCRERGSSEPLRYAPDPGRGVVITRDVPDGPYVVLSALGMGPDWQTGSTVSERQVRRARPLR
jgi:hypothetical protein